MRAINHALTGAIVGLSVSQPVVAVPLALATHYALDALPHYNPRGSTLDIMRNKWFVPILMIDALLCFGLVIVLIINLPGGWQLPALTAFIATSPDLFSFSRLTTAIKDNKLLVYDNKIMNFAERIQWFQRPIGGFVELAWAASAIYVVAFLISK